MKVNLGELVVTSPGFEHGDAMPSALAQPGATPELEWSNVPASTRSFALVCDDPDAPLITGFVHWVVYNIPGDARALTQSTLDASTYGVNGLGETAWVPAGPPPGHGTHYYYFHLYALDSEPDLAPGMTKDKLLATIDPLVIEQARVVGTFETQPA